MPGWSGPTPSLRPREFRPEVVLYAWPPPGRSVAPLCQADFLHYLIIVGEAGGGATGAREDWETLPHKVSPALSRVRPGTHRRPEPTGDRLLRREEDGHRVRVQE